MLHSEAASQLVKLSLRSIFDETRYCLSRPSMEFCGLEELGNFQDSLGVQHFS